MPTYELKRRRLHRKRWVLDWQRRIPKQEDKLLFIASLIRRKGIPDD